MELFSNGPRKPDIIWFDDMFLPTTTPLLIIIVFFQTTWQTTSHLLTKLFCQWFSTRKTLVNKMDNQRFLSLDQKDYLGFPNLLKEKKNRHACKMTPRCLKFICFWLAWQILKGRKGGVYFLFLWLLQIVHKSLSQG